MSSIISGEMVACDWLRALLAVHYFPVRKNNSKWPPMNAVLMFYTFEDKCITPMYK